MTITFATIVSRGYCFLNEFRSGRCRSCLFAIYGALSVLLNDAALEALISITYAWSVRDEELSSSPPRGARTHGLPMMTDWKSPETSMLLGRLPLNIYYSPSVWVLMSPFAIAVSLLWKRLKA